MSVWAPKAKDTPLWIRRAGQELAAREGSLQEPGDKDTLLNRGATRSDASYIWDRLGLARDSLGSRAGSQMVPDSDLENMMDITQPQPKRATWIIYPDRTFRRVWLQVTLAIALYIVWVTPIRVGYNMQSQGFFFWMEGIMNLYFMVDLFLNFFIAYEHPATSEVITNHKLIAQRYITSGWFWIDLLATFPSDFLIKAFEGTFVCSVFDSCYYIVPNDVHFGFVVFFRCMRFFRVIWIIKNFHVISIRTLLGRVRDELLEWGWLISVFEILVVLMILAHVAGCFFYMFGLPQWHTSHERELVAQGLMTTWILDKIGTYDVTEIPKTVAYINLTQPINQRYTAVDPLTDMWYICPVMSTIKLCMECDGPHFRCNAVHNFYFRYTTSTYWAYTTMTTVGYGDICGSTISEKIWTIVTMVLGGFFLSFCFGRGAVIVSRLDANNAARTEQLEQITEFIRDVELPKIMARRVMDFSRSSVKSIKPYDRSAVLAILPFDLRTKIMQHLYLGTIKRIPILQKYADDEVFLTDLCTRLQLYHCSADTFVYLKGESSSAMYILTNGEMRILANDRKTPLLKVPQGTVFGENALIRRLDGETKIMRTENIYCISECDMLFLAADDLVYLCDINQGLAHDLRRLDKTRQSKLKQLSIQAQAGVGPAIVPTLTRLADLPVEDEDADGHKKRDSAGGNTGDTEYKEEGSSHGGRRSHVEGVSEKGLQTFREASAHGRHHDSLPDQPSSCPDSPRLGHGHGHGLELPFRTTPLTHAHMGDALYPFPSSHLRYNSKEMEVHARQPEEMVKLIGRFEDQVQSLREEVMSQRKVLADLPAVLAAMMVKRDGADDTAAVAAAALATEAAAAAAAASEAPSSTDISKVDSATPVSL